MNKGKKSIGAAGMEKKGNCTPQSVSSRNFTALTRGVNHEFQGIWTLPSKG
jgi:hypothetical protein